MRNSCVDLSHKYAFNINNTNNESRILPPTNLKNLSKGFYDDIEEDDLQIKSKTKLLQKIKNDSLKEFVFTNRLIPDHWKKKLNYQHDVIKMFVKDRNFLAYVGRNPAVEPPPPTFGDIESNENKKIKSVQSRNTSYMSEFPKIGKKYFCSNDLSEKEHEDITSNITSSKNVNARYKITKKGVLTDKDIVLLLEEFKNAYPLTDQKPITDEKKKKKEKIDKNNSLEFSKTYNLSTPFLPVKKKNNDPFSNIHKMKLRKRQQAFRQSIFNNLIPPKKKLHVSKSVLIKNDKNEESSIFLNCNINSFNKKIEINNPVIKKHLDSINFYGPYYSYCPPCRNRNLEFYNKLEQGQCLKIIQYIKKIIGRKNFLNIKETKKSDQSEEDQKEKKNNHKKIFKSGKLNEEEIFGKSEGEKNE